MVKTKDISKVASDLTRLIGELNRAKALEDFDRPLKIYSEDELLREAVQLLNLFDK
jgi:hypothetical protein